MSIDPSVSCRTCQIARGEATSRAVDMSCEDCCVRHLLRMIETMGAFGGEGHAERIKDRLFEALERGVK